MYDKILVPVDASPTSDAGLAEAVRLARLSGGRLRLLHVVQDLSHMAEALAYTDSPDALMDGVPYGDALLARLGDLVALDGVSVDTVLIEGSGNTIHELVADQAEAWGADIVVLGTHGRSGLGRVVLGSVAEQIVRRAVTPVLLVRCAEEDQAAEPGLQSIAAAIA